MLAEDKAQQVFPVNPLLAADTVTSGTVEMTITFMGVDIWTNSEDLCTKTTCPLQKGPVTITLVENLPPIAPPVRTPCLTACCNCHCCIQSISEPESASQGMRCHMGGLARSVMCCCMLCFLWMHHMLTGRLFCYSGHIWHAP